MPAHTIQTAIWSEQPEADNPFATRVASCRGYDVYGDMLGRARWIDMLHLLFRGEAPNAAESTLLEALAFALANPGPRDPSVHAAMAAGVGGSPAAATLIAALAVGAGGYTGAREVFLAVTLWNDCGTSLPAWRQRVAEGLEDAAIWPECDHAPGFDLHGTRTPTIVRQALERLAQCSPGPRLRWLAEQRIELEAIARAPLAMSGVAAAAFADLAMPPETSEMLYLLLRLPGAAAHALEQRRNGHKAFPFFGLDLQDDPALQGASA